MTGALIKTWYAQKEGIDPKDIVSVSVMPCTAKKFEIQRDDEDAAGVPDVDIVHHHPRAGPADQAGPASNFERLPDEKFDDAMGVSTGAGVIFGATGGVMEAALRTAADLLTGEEPGVRGVHGDPRHRGHQGGRLQRGRHGCEGGRGQRPVQRGRSC